MLIDPDTGTIESARDRISRLLGELERHADPLGCPDELAHAWTLLRANGAGRQRCVADQLRVDGLLRWLANTTSAEPLKPQSDPRAPKRAAAEPVTKSAALAETFA
jgi:gamma-glutamyl:cysteine ligase YbdK (ATP-grasp superfamily)